MNLARLSWEKVVVVVGLALDADVLQPGSDSGLEAQYMCPIWL